MKKRFSHVSFVPVLAGLALVGLAGGTVLGASFDLAEHLGPDTPVFLSLDDLDSSWSRFPDTPLGRTFADEEIRQFLARMGGDASSQSMKMEGPGGLPIRFDHGLEGALPARVSFAILPSAPGDRGDLGVVGSLSLGEERDATVTLLNALIDQLRSVEPESCQGRISTIQGEIQRLSILGVSVSYFWNDDTLVFGTRRADLIRILSSIADPHEDGLAAAPRFRELRKSTGAGSGGMFLYHAPGAEPIGSGNSRESRILRALGLDGIAAVGLSSSMLESGRGVTRLRIQQAGPNRGWLDALGRGEGPFRTTNHLSPRAVASLTMRLDPRGVSRLASRLTAGLGYVPRQTAGGKSGREPHETPWPIDLARALGEEAGFYLAPPRAGPVPEIGLVVLLRDPVRAEQALVRGVTSPVGIRMRMFERRGRRYFRLDPRVSTPMLTSVTVADGVLVAGTNITVVDDMLKRAKAEGALTLGKRAEFRRVVAAAPANASAILFVDTPRIIRWVYGSFGPLVVWGVNMSQQHLPDFNPLTWADFPSGDSLTRHLGPAVTWFTSDEGGLTAESRSDLQSEITTFSFLAGIGVKLTTVRVRAMDKPVAADPEFDRPPPPVPSQEKIEKRRREAWCRLCHTNLELFRTAFVKYRRDHEGRLPPDLAAFFGPGPARGPQYLSPADQSAWRAHREGRSHPSSYIYVGPDIPRKVAWPDRFALVWNRAPFHEGRRLVLFLNGSIRLLPEAEFQKVLAETMARVGK